MTNKFKIEKKVICSKCGKLIQSYMDDAFNPQWTDISPYRGRVLHLCNECIPEPPDFTKRDEEEKENILKLKNLFNTLLNAYYDSQKLVLDEACISSEELIEEVNEYKNELNKLLKLLKKE
ncbi:MAG: hypothetical protein AABW67_02510 [Nanoarchaeota archaeon]